MWSMVVRNQNMRDENEALGNQLLLNKLKVKEEKKIAAANACLIVPLGLIP